MEDPDDSPMEKSLLGYIDILGFSDRVRTVMNSGPDAVAQEIEHLHQLVESTYSFAKRMNESKLPLRVRLHVLSDTVLITQPLQKGNPWAFAAVCTRLATHIICYYGLPVRGALVVDDHYEKGPVIFSPALVEAAQIERHHAIWPRLLVSDEFQHHYWQVVRDQVTKGQRHDQPILYDLLWEDEDDKVFLNYLQLSLFQAKGGKSQFRKLPYQHRDLVQKGLATSKEGGILEKYRWLARYHNAFCRSPFARDRCQDAEVQGCAGEFRSLLGKEMPELMG